MVVGNELYLTVKDKVIGVSKMLLELLDSGVWIHEKPLSKLLKLPTGVNFGQKKALTFLIEGIQKGYWGNKRGDHIESKHDRYDLSVENSANQIVYQKIGKPEPFSGGKELE